MPFGQLQVSNPCLPIPVNNIQMKTTPELFVGVTPHYQIIFLTNCVQCDRLVTSPTQQLHYRYSFRPGICLSRRYLLKNSATAAFSSFYRGFLDLLSPFKVIGGHFVPIRHTFVSCEYYSLRMATAR